MIDDRRFERVYAEYGPSVLRYATYSLGSREVAEDVAAETFARFIERGGHVPDDKTEAWLVRVAGNLCRSHHRSKTRERRLLNRLEADYGSADAWPEPDCWHQLIVLKESERLVVYLRVIEDRPFAEIARLTGKSVSASKMTFYRAVEKLRQRHCALTSAAPLTSLGGAQNE